MNGQSKTKKIDFPNQICRIFSLKLIQEINNFSISTNDLQSDLLAADLCIYWGSTVAVEALAMGLPLICFDLEQPLSNDPLFQCDHLKWVVRRPDSLEAVIDEINSLEDDEFERQSRMARTYVKMQKNLM